MEHILQADAGCDFDFLRPPEGAAAARVHHGDPAEPARSA
jgi:hypothetical protein